MNSIKRATGYSGGQPVNTALLQQKINVADDSGYKMQMDEISFNQIDLKWGNYVNVNEKILSFHPVKSTIVSHFRISDPAATQANRPAGITEKQFVIYRELPEAYHLRISPTAGKVCSFFELAISESFFQNMYTDENSFMHRFNHYSSSHTPSFQFKAPMVAAMYNIISDMHCAPYQGHLKGVYLEAKAIELFLLQVKQLQGCPAPESIKLKPADVESLHHIKQYLQLHHHQTFSIAGLAQKAGINQTKLKSGFKHLFGTTIFNYITDLRLQNARSLLLDERRLVSEVSEISGYKHPHHFAAAFKKKFGVLPSHLKS